MNTEPTCDHGLHHKYAIRDVGFVCTGCDPTWREVGNSGPYSLLEHRTAPDAATSRDRETDRKAEG